jgi:apolipoprotein N-acyltransferase
MNTSSTAFDLGYRKRSKLLRRILMALSSAVLMALSLPNEVFKYGFPPLGFIALVPLWAVLLECESYGAAAFTTAIFGSLQHALSSYWLYFFKGFAFWTLGSTTIAYGVVYAVFGLYLGFFARKGGLGRPLAFAALWGVFEFMKSNGFLGYPWGLLAYTQTRILVLLQIADITGVYGISAVLALCNAVIVELLIGLGVSSSDFAPLASYRIARRAFSARLRLSYSAYVLAILALCLGYGTVRLSQTPPIKAHFKALMVQQDVDPWNTGDTAALEANIRLSKEALARSPGVKPDIILFSEMSLGAPYQGNYDYYSSEPPSMPFIPFIRATGAYVFTGAPDVLSWQPLSAMNAVILIDPNARLVASYGKVHPVPFAESIPFWEYAPFRHFMQRVVGLDSGWTVGTKYTVFTLPTKDGDVRFGAPICFEDAFPSVCRQFFLRGADLLVNLTNDSWSTTESAEIQHWAAARFRSIEFRKTLVRSTNGGLSCVVGPHGELQMELPFFKPESRIVDVPVYASPFPTIYERFGDWFAEFLLLLSAVWAIILIAKDLGFAPGQRRMP